MFFMGTTCKSSLEETTKKGFGAITFAYHVDVPERYGVVEFDDSGIAYIFMIIALSNWQKILNYLNTTN